MQELKPIHYKINKIVNSLSMELILLVFSFLEAILLLNLFKTKLNWLAIATYSPIDGHAFLRAFQNRLLPAEIMSLIDSVNILSAYRIFILVFTFICNILVFILFIKLGNKKALVMTFMFSLAFILFQDQNPPLLYGWDFIDVAITILVLIGIENNSGIWYYICLFTIGIFNRESAIYIPLWMLISAFPKEKRKMVYSSAMLLIGVGLIYYLRVILFKGSIRLDIGLDESNKLLGNHILLFKNLFYLFDKPFFVNIRFAHYTFIPAIIVVSYLY